MKKLITICLLLATTFSVNAQEMSFEETVNYINEIFKENKIAYHQGGGKSGRWVKGISADKTGKIIIYDRYKDDIAIEVDKLNVIMNSINLFDIGLYETLDGELYLHTTYSVGYDFVGRFSGISVPLASRLKKALKHLGSLSNKKSDPFGN